MQTRLRQCARIGLFLFVLALVPFRAVAAPYAALVMDARSGEVIHSRNADTQLHPASLTKMMTLYIAFEAIEHGEISLDTMVTVSKNAASEPPSKLGLRAGQKIALRYLIRAAAVKSANDAATAIGEAISGSEAAFARRMNRTAKALGMTRTHFKNANGLTEAGHMSTARDMTTLGRHVFYDYPGYYNLFSRRTADAGMRKVNNTNTRFLNAYKGADGIKTGYTRAAGFNLVASAERGDKRLITTVFGGQSTASRNKQVAELMDLGFRKAPTRVAVRRPAMPTYQGNIDRGTQDPVAVAVAETQMATPPGAAGKTIRIVGAPINSIRPRSRPEIGLEVPSDAIVAALEEGIEAVIEDITTVAAEVVVPEPGKAAIAAAAPVTTPAPAPRPAGIILASVTDEPEPSAVEQEVVTRMSTSGGRHWGINVGLYRSHYEAERVLLKTALAELSSLGEALRKVSSTSRGHAANFVGLTEDGADMACRRLQARAVECKVIGPS